MFKQFHVYWENILKHFWKDNLKLKKTTHLVPEGKTLHLVMVCGANVAAYVLDIFVLCLYICLYALSTVFHSMNPPPTILYLLIFFFPFYFCLIDPFNYVSLYEGLPSPDILSIVVDWAQNTSEPSRVNKVWDIHAGISLPPSPIPTPTKKLWAEMKIL